MAIGTPVDLGHQQSTSANTLSLTTSAAVTAGDLILVFWASTSSGTNVTSVTNTAGDTPFLSTTGATSPEINVSWFANSAGMASSSNITVNFNATTRCAFSAMKVAGMNTTTSFVRDARSAPTTTTGTATSATSQVTPSLSTTKSLLVGATAHNSTDPGVWTPGGSFTSIGGTTATLFLKTAYLIVSTAAPVTWAPTWVNSAIYRSTVQVFIGAQTGAGGGLSLTGVG